MLQRPQIASRIRVRIAASRNVSMRRYTDEKIRARLVVFITTIDIYVIKTTNHAAGARPHGRVAEYVDTSLYG